MGKGYDACVAILVFDSGIVLGCQRGRGWVQALEGGPRGDVHAADR